MIKTEQEKFWAGQFGDQYIERNKTDQYLASNIAMFSEILNHTGPLESVIEFGSNIGMNLKAIEKLQPGVKLSAVEINEKAVQVMKENNPAWNVYGDSILDFKQKSLKDMVLVKGVLIHMNPGRLSDVYQTLYDVSRRYICIAEYYNPSPVELPYRGHRDRLFKRDFAGEMMEQFKDLKLKSYGFRYHRDPIFPQDDINWFLLEK